jgi:DNA-binding protein HU-beta
LRLRIVELNTRVCRLEVIRGQIRANRGLPAGGEGRPRTNKEMRMNKMDLIEHVAGEMDMSRSAANRAVDTIIDGITKALKKGEEVRITGFGTFTVKKRAAGKGRNPATGEAIKIPASKNARFKAGATLKAAVNKGR